MNGPIMNFFEDGRFFLWRVKVDRKLELDFFIILMMCNNMYHMF